MFFRPSNRIFNLVTYITGKSALKMFLHMYIPISIQYQKCKHIEEGKINHLIRNAKNKPSEALVCH